MTASTLPMRYNYHTYSTYTDNPQLSNKLSSGNDLLLQLARFPKPVQSQRYHTVSPETNSTPFNFPIPAPLILPNPLHPAADSNKPPKQPLPLRFSSPDQSHQPDHPSHHAPQLPAAKCPARRGTPANRSSTPAARQHEAARLVEWEPTRKGAHLPMCGPAEIAWWAHLPDLNRVQKGTMQFERDWREI